MSDAAMAKLLKKDRLQSSRLAGRTIEIPGWDKRNEPFHTETDCMFLILIHSDRVALKFSRRAGRSGPEEVREAESQWRQRWRCRWLEQPP